MLCSFDMAEPAFTFLAHKETIDLSSQDENLDCIIGSKFRRSLVHLSYCSKAVMLLVLSVHLHFLLNFNDLKSMPE